MERRSWFTLYIDIRIKWEYTPGNPGDSLERSHSATRLEGRGGQYVSNDSCRSSQASSCRSAGGMHPACQHRSPFDGDTKASLSTTSYSLPGSAACFRWDFVQNFLFKIWGGYVSSICTHPALRSPLLPCTRHRDLVLFPQDRRSCSHQLYSANPPGVPCRR